MSQFLAKKYAGLIDRETIKQLYQKYEEYEKISRSDASKNTMLTRNTLNRIIYSEKSISTTTKEKILDKSLKIMPHFTVGFLTQRLYDSATESLQIYLGQINEKLFDTDDKKEYDVLIDQYYNTLKRFQGLIHDNIETETADMVSQIMGDAKRKEFQIHSPDYLLESTPSEIGSPFTPFGISEPNTPKILPSYVDNSTGFVMT